MTPNRCAVFDRHDRVTVLVDGSWTSGNVLTVTLESLVIDTARGAVEIPEHAVAERVRRVALVGAEGGARRPLGGGHG
jgi:hypothetical protein